MPIYTRRGDKGKTSLYGGEGTVSKKDQRIVAYGTIDELNSQLGVVSSLLANQPGTKGYITKVQQDLFEIASELATEGGAKPPFGLRKARITRLERLIDRLTSKMPPLVHFIFPGGTQASSHLHVARSVCRRAEREVVALALYQNGSGLAGVNPNIIAYLNRLSDLLFTLSRFVNYQAGIAERRWVGSPGRAGIKKRTPK